MRLSRRQMIRASSAAVVGMALAGRPTVGLSSQRDVPSPPTPLPKRERGEGQPSVREAGPDGEHRYPMVYAMGGKNVYYFLTPL